MELTRKGGLTTYGLPSQTMRELKMMQILQPMKPIMDRSKEHGEVNLRNLIILENE